MGRTIQITERDLLGTHVFDNTQYIRNCFDSIKRGDPIRVEIHDGHTISCLEHILTDITQTGSIARRSDESINPLIFEYLADPAINLEMALCSGIKSDGDYDLDHETSCIPRVIESFAALKQYKHPLLNEDGSKNDDKSPYNSELFNRVVANVRSVTRRYPYYLSGTQCRRRRSSEMVSCLDAILMQANNWRAIDINAVPTDVFSGTKCSINPDGRYLSVPCYEAIVREALRNTGEHHSTQTAYANTLLIKLLSLERFDYDLIKDAGMCYGGKYMSCFDGLVNQMTGSRSPYKAVETVLNRYSSDGVVNTTDSSSIFYGEQCTNGDISYDKRINCFDLILKRALEFNPESTNKITSNAPDSDTKSYNTIIDTMMDSSRYSNNPCKLLDIITDTYTEYKSSSKKSMVVRQIQKILGFKGTSTAFAGQEGGLARAISRHGNIACMIGDADGKSTTFLDYITDKPIILDIMRASFTNVDFVLSLNREGCTSKYGVKQNCIAKIIDKLLRDGGDKNYYQTVDGLVRITSGWYRGGSSQSTAMSISSLNNDDMNLYNVDRGVAIRVGEETPQLNAYIVDEIEDVIVGMDTDEYINANGRNGGAVDDLIHLIMQKGLMVDLMKLDSALSQISRFVGGYDCEPYVNYLTNVQGNGFTSDEDFEELLKGTRVLFGGLCLKKSVDLLKTLYTHTKNEELRETIRDRVSQVVEKTLPVGNDSVGEASEFNGIDPTYRYKVDLLMYKQNPKDPRYCKEPSRISSGNSEDSVTSFYYYLNPDKMKSGESAGGETTYNYNQLDRWNYDAALMRDFNNGKEYKGDQSFVEDVLSNPKFATTMREEEFGITGSYEVYIDATSWDSERRERYAQALIAVIYGGGHRLYEPYVPKGRYREGDSVPIDIGLKKALEEIMKPESVGQRKDNRTATAKFTFIPDLTTKYDLGGAIRNDLNDVQVKVEYIDDATHVPIAEMTKVFPFREIMQSLPKKALKGLQEKHGKLLGLVQLVVTYENEQSRAGVTTYLMNISNRPSDLMRISTGHSWDMGSCMRLGENPNRYVYKEHNIAVNGYIDFRSYVAYLTKESPYEPKWYGRIQMHRCHDSDNTPLISVQHSSLGYDVGGNYHAYSDILNEAITVAFSEKGLNDKCTGRCKHYWADPGVTNRRGYTYHDYTDNGGKCVKYSLEKSDVKDILRRRTRGTNKPSDFVKQVSTTF